MKVNILKFDHFGRGIGKIYEKVIFVEKALPGEIVDVIITKEKTNYLVGKIENVLKCSIDRIKPICPFYDKCGGCNFLHTTYENEKKFKLEKGKELLGNIDNFYETNNLNYRNKATLHVMGNDIGFYIENSNELIDIDYCYLLDNNINKVIGDLKQIGLSKYNISEIIIKANQDKLLISIDNNVDDYFLDKFNYVDTIICKDKTVKGKGFIEEAIANKTFKITANAFFQVNKNGLLNIYEIVNNFLNNKKIDNVLDLYSGTSLWGILVSGRVLNVTCVEINKEAVLNAKDNIKSNNIENIKVINGDVAKYIDKFNNIDLVIIDPPRSGLNKKTRDYLKIINSKYVIYISCDMQTLKRDLLELEEKYSILNIDLVDMFRGTYHCESIVILERK